MPSSSLRFRLKVQQVESTCLFELSWGEGQQLTAHLQMPSSLMQHYHIWQQTYLSFYKSNPEPITVPQPSQSMSSLRGRAIASGHVSAAPTDWHSRLVQAEAIFLYEFQQWLRQGELYEIRAAIAQATHQASAEHPSDTTAKHVTVFLTCTPLEVARFPWEAWELRTEFAAVGQIDIVRSPANIRAEAIRSVPHRRKARILAILGDDTGLNFQADRDAVASLARVADITFIGWQPGQAVSDVKTQICQTIADADGWDVLFFAGHSNETQITGGELAIAPGASFSVQEIAPYLTTARQRGLQVAIFNSCNGLNIAESLIDLGFSHVAVMREPIHNRVAHAFLIRFLRWLGAHQTVQTALVNACQELKTDLQFTFPSGYLIPSLFCHPGATLFRIPPRGWRRRLQTLLPSRTEAIALVACTVLASIPSFQGSVLNWRVWAQAIYRDWTAQVPQTSSTQAQPVTLVQVDEQSVRLSGMTQPNPIDRAYLAELLDRLVEHDASIIGIDYLLDRQQPNRDSILMDAVRRAVEQETWLVFAGRYYPEGEIGVGDATAIADFNWSLQGYIESATDSMMLPDQAEDCRQTCPFSYLLALIATTQMTLPESDIHPQLTRTQDLRSQLIDQTEQVAAHYPSLDALERSRFHPLNTWAFNTLSQSWLTPVIDYSIPPDAVYQVIPAWTLLDHATPASPIRPYQVVIIAPGGYGEAGIGRNSDNFKVPRALAYWRQHPAREASTAGAVSSEASQWLTGSEVHAYTVHHLLNQHMIIAIPDVWMVGAAVGGAVMIRTLLSSRFGRPVHSQIHITSIRLTRRAVNAGGLVVGSTALYGWLSLQLYVAGGILLPWLLPSVMFWIYLLPSFLNRRSFSHA